MTPARARAALPEPVGDALEAIHRIRVALMARRVLELWPARDGTLPDPPSWLVLPPDGLRNELDLEIGHPTPEAAIRYDAELARLRAYDRENREMLAEALRAHARLVPIKALSAGLRDDLARCGDSLPATIAAVLAFRDALARIGGEAIEAFVLDLDQTVAGLRDAIFAAIAHRLFDGRDAMRFAERRETIALLIDAADRGWLTDPDAIRVRAVAEAAE
jgi:hypothetical protein